MGTHSSFLLDCPRHFLRLPDEAMRPVKFVLDQVPPERIVDLWFGPGPFREIVENWVDVVWAGVAALRREASRFCDPRLEQLVRRAEAHARAMPAPDTAVDVTACELRVELMFPADETATDSSSN
jgi:hypothetical protein